MRGDEKKKSRRAYSDTCAELKSKFTDVNVAGGTSSERYGIKEGTHLLIMFLSEDLMFPLKAGII